MALAGGAAACQSERACVGRGRRTESIGNSEEIPELQARAARVRPRLAINSIARRTLSGRISHLHKPHSTVYRDFFPICVLYCRIVRLQVRVPAPQWWKGLYSQRAYLCRTSAKMISMQTSQSE